METPFDQLLSNETLQMLKLLIPYISPETQRLLAVYIKFSELQYTLHFFQHFQPELHTQDFNAKHATPAEIIQDIRPYLSEKTSETLDTVLNMINMMDVFQTFKNFSDGCEETEGDFNPMSMMKNILTPEQQDMFEQYSTIFAQSSMTETETETEIDKKGEDSDDRLDEGPPPPEHGCFEN